MKYIYSLIIGLTVMCWQVDARKAKGRVTCDNQGVSSVIVTDGNSFTTTAANGEFSLRLDKEADFVYIISPSGYSAEWSNGSPAFYIPTEGNKSFNFELSKTGNDSDTYNIIAVGDPQPRSINNFEEFAGRPLDDLSQTVSKLEGRTVGIALGDISFDRYQLNLKWKQKITRAGIPFYTAVGNHDHNKSEIGDTLSIQTYRKDFGPENHAFFIGGDIVIVLDNIIYKTAGKYSLGYTDAILSWVSGLMKYVPETSDIYIAQHCPLNGRHYKKMIENHNRLLNILKGHKVTFLSGHNHTNGVFEYAPGVTEHNIAAICGTWWEAYHCTDGTPRGYKVFTKKDGELSWYYKAVDQEKDFQYEVFMPGTTRLNPDCIVVNVWDYDPQWSIEWMEDGKDMGAMKQVEEYSPLHEKELADRYKGNEKGPSKYKKTRISKHYFAARPSESAKEITIRIRTRFGKVMTEKITF